MPNTKEKGKLIEVLSKHIPYGYATLCLIADELMAEGVTVSGDKDINVPTKWISVKDRLPEKNEDGTVNAVLVTNGSIQHIAYLAKDVFYFTENGEMKEPMFYEVTHWQYLPQPPKGE